MDNVTIKKTYEFRKFHRSNVEGVWDFIQRYIMPFRAVFYRDQVDEAAVDWRKRHIYDDTAVTSAQSLAATLNSNLTSPVIRWFEITVSDTRVRRRHAVRIWLEQVSELMYQFLQASNFNLSSSETYLDLVGFGTAGMIMESRERNNGTLDKTLYKAVPIDQCYFDEDEEGRPINFYRELMWSPLQMVDKFGAENVPSDIVKDIEDPKKANIKQKVIFCVFRRFEIDKESPRPVAPRQRPYGAKYILHKTTESIGGEQGYYEMPVFLPRWRKVSGSQWGYSPGMVNLSNIMSLNKLVEIILRGNEKMIDPPILSTKRGILGDYDLRAGRITTVKSIDAIKQWEFKGRLDYGFMQRDAMQHEIREGFFIDQLQLKESPAMTATEVSVRYQLMQKLLGPSVGQIQYDFLGPMLVRTFNTMMYYRLLPPPPQELGQAPLDIEYLGPMAKAQKQDSVIAIERWLMNILQLAQTFPNASDVPNIDETVTELGYAAGVPAKVINSKASIMKERMKRAQQQQQATKMAMAEQASNIQKNIQPSEQEAA